MRARSAGAHAYAPNMHGRTPYAEGRREGPAKPLAAPRGSKRTIRRQDAYAPGCAASQLWSASFVRTTSRGSIGLSVRLQGS